MRVAGIWGCSEISFFLLECLSRYMWGGFCWGHIRCCGDGGLGFRPYGGSLLTNASKVTKKACSYVRPARWGSGFLRCGIDPGAAPTVCCAAPPLAVFGCAKRSLRSHPRINPSTQPSDVALQIKIKICSRACAHPASGAAAPRDLCRSCRRLRSFDLASGFERSTSKDRSLRQLRGVFKSVSKWVNLPTRFSGCPSDVGALGSGCR
ncbi:hypothetical protein SAMN04488483_3148 [Pseudomonas helmanticensis]|uniref:Uncharacterized protein n=1 Tax=Pseudomonas helmanticensis TaxID=1471381 RepID=A0ACD2U7T0_9PSED|nr:hypothetical protein SAMN04488483_3148 [Pseudomonas helmanticensis]